MSTVMNMNQFIDNDGRLVSAVGMAMFQNELSDGRERLFFYTGNGRLTNGTNVEIVFYTDCQMEADEHAHKYVNSDGQDEWYITPFDLVRGLADGSYALAYCGDGTPTERAKEAERLRATGDYDDDVPWEVD